MALFSWMLEPHVKVQVKQIADPDQEWYVERDGAAVGDSSDPRGWSVASAGDDSDAFSVLYASDTAPMPGVYRLVVRRTDSLGRRLFRAVEFPVQEAEPRVEFLNFGSEFTPEEGVTGAALSADSGNGPGDDGEEVVFALSGITYTVSVSNLQTWTTDPGNNPQFSLVRLSDNLIVGGYNPSGGPGYNSGTLPISGFSSFQVSPNAAPAGDTETIFVITVTASGDIPGDGNYALRVWNSLPNSGSSNFQIRQAQIPNFTQDLTTSVFNLSTSPSTPTNPTLSATLTWFRPSNYNGNATGINNATYYVYRRTTSGAGGAIPALTFTNNNPLQPSGGTWSYIGQTTSSANPVTFTDPLAFPGTSANTQYTYLVMAQVSAFQQGAFEPTNPRRWRLISETNDSDSIIKTIPLPGQASAPTVSQVGFSQVAISFTGGLLQYAEAQRIEMSTNGGANWSTASINNGFVSLSSANRCNQTLFRAVQSNRYGDGPVSTTVTVRHDGPATPITAALSGDGTQVQLTARTARNTSSGTPPSVTYVVRRYTQNTNAFLAESSTVSSAAINDATINFDLPLPPAGAQVRYDIIAQGLALTGASSSDSLPTTGPNFITAPTSGTLTATTGNKRNLLNWAVGLFNGQAGVPQYVLQVEFQKRVYNAANGAEDNWTSVGPFSASSSYTLTDSGLTNGTTYEYRVRAINTSGGSGGVSAWSGIVSATPYGPENLSAERIADSLSGVRLSFQLLGAAPGGSSLRVFRSTTSGADFTQVGSDIAVVGGQTDYTFDDTDSKIANQTYYYVVGLVVGGVISSAAYSNEANITLSLGAPTSVSAAPIAGTLDEIRVTFIHAADRPTTPELSVLVFRSTTNDVGTATQVGSVPYVSAAQFDDTTTPKQFLTTYYYWLRYGTTGAVFSTAASTQLITPDPPVIAPSYLATDENDFQIEWTPSEDTPPGTEWRVERNTTTGWSNPNDAGWTVIAGPLTVTSYTDSTAKVNGQRYRYRVSYWDYPTIRSAVAQRRYIETPATPEGFGVRPGIGSASLRWDDTPASGSNNVVDTYALEYAESDEGPWTEITDSATADPVEVTGLTNEKRYFFRIKAANEIGESDWAHASAFITDPPAIVLWAPDQQTPTIDEPPLTYTEVLTDRFPADQTTFVSSVSPTQYGYAYVAAMWDASTNKQVSRLRFTAKSSGTDNVNGTYGTYYPFFEWTLWVRTASGTNWVNLTNLTVNSSSGTAPSNATWQQFPYDQNAQINNGGWYNVDITVPGFGNPNAPVVLPNYRYWFLIVRANPDFFGAFSLSSAQEGEEASLDADSAVTALSAPAIPPSGGEGSSDGLSVVYLSDFRLYLSNDEYGDEPRPPAPQNCVASVGAATLPGGGATTKAIITWEHPSTGTDSFSSYLVQVRQGYYWFNSFSGESGVDWQPWEDLATVDKDTLTYEDLFNPAITSSDYGNFQYRILSYREPISSDPSNTAQINGAILTPPAPPLFMATAMCRSNWETWQNLKVSFLLNYYQAPWDADGQSGNRFIQIQWTTDDAGSPTAAWNTITSQSSAQFFGNFQLLNFNERYPFAPFDGNTDNVPLSTGATYTFRMRYKNESGYSPWSPLRSAIAQSLRNNFVAKNQTATFQPSYWTSGSFSGANITWAIYRGSKTQATGQPGGGGQVATSANPQHNGQAGPNWTWFVMCERAPADTDGEAEAFRLRVYAPPFLQPSDANDWTYYVQFDLSKAFDANYVNGYLTTYFEVLDITPPAAPTGLVATATSDKIDLSWDAVAGTGVTYLVFRADSEGALTYVSAVGPDQAGTTYQDTPPQQGKLYYYQVRSVVQGVRSNPSNTANAMTIPAPPTNLAAEIINLEGGGRTVKLTWTRSAGLPAPTAVQVVRVANQGDTPTWPFPTTLGDVTEWTDPNNGVYTNGATFHFRVRSRVGNDGYSAYTGFVTVTVGTPGPTLTSITTSGTSITIHWDAPSTGTPAKYRVFRRRNDLSTYTQIHETADGSVVAYTDATPTAGELYVYMVRAVDGSNNESNSSNLLSARTLPSAPSTPTATAQAGGIKIDWTASAVQPLANNFRLERGTQTGGPYGTNFQTGNVSTYTDVTVMAGTRYYYRLVPLIVTSATGTAEGPATAEVLMTSRPAAPTLNLPSISGQTVTLSWSAVTVGAGVTLRYRVFRGTASGGPYGTEITSGGGTSATTIQDTPPSNITVYYVVQAVADSTSGGNSNQQSVLVTSALNPPQNLSASRTGTSVSLTWQAPAGNPSLTSYNIYRSTTSGSFSGTPQAVVGGSTLAYNDTLAYDGFTYYYVVRAVQNTSQSANSNQASVTVPPGSPSSVTAFVSGGSGVLVTITNVARATGYVVYRSATENGTYVQVGTPAAQAGSVTTFTHAGGVAGDWYKVAATNAGGEGDLSTAVQAGAVAAPTLTSAAQEGSGIRLNFTLPVGQTNTAVRVYRATVSGGYSASPYASLSGTATTYLDGGAATGTLYYYVVRCVSSGFESGNSNEMSARTIPPAPTAISATAATGGVTVSWTANGTAPLQTGHRIERALSLDGPWTPTAAQPATAGSGSLVDTTVASATRYYYRVFGTASGVDSAARTMASSVLSYPRPPASLTATAQAGGIQLNWTAVTGGDGVTVSYVVYRSTSAGGPFTTPIFTGTSNAHLDTTAVAGTRYYYVAAARAGSSPVLESGLSAVANAIIAPQPPTLVTITRSGEEVTLTWQAPASGPIPTQYQVSRSQNSSFTGETTVGLFSDLSGTETFEDFDGRRYYYRVRSVLGASLSAPSNVLSILLPPGVPTLQAIGGNTFADLKWTGVARATSYKVYRRQGSLGSFVFVREVTGTSGRDNSLTNGQLYQYIVRSVNDGGEGEDSNIASAHPSTAPRFVSATTDRTGRVIDILFDAPILPGAPQTVEGVAVLVNGVQRALVSAQRLGDTGPALRTVRVVLSSSVRAGDSITVSYDGPL